MSEPRVERDGRRQSYAFPIGFIGLGHMGKPIVQHLLRAGLHVEVFDIDAAVLAEARDAGAIVRGCPAAIGDKNSVVFTCVPGAPDVEAALFGAGGFLSEQKSGSIIVEMSAIGVSEGREFARRARAQGVEFIDAPLSGGETGAISGQLTAFVGGEEAVLQSVSGLLKIFSAKIFHLGQSGSGYLAKALNQMIYLSYVASFCEAMALGRLGGLDTGVLVEAIKSSVGGNPFVTNWDARLLSGDISTGFRITRVLKDLASAEGIAHAIDFNAPILASVISSFRQAVDGGRGDADFTALYHLAIGDIQPV